MNREQRRDIFEAIGLTAIVASLVFLALEIRQANRIAIANTELAVRESFGSSNETVYTNPEFAALLVRARNQDAEFTDTEQEMLDYWFARMTNIWMQIDRAYSHGLVSDATFGIAVEDMKWTSDAYPALRPTIKGWMESYPSVSQTGLYEELVQHLGEIE